MKNLVEFINEGLVNEARWEIVDWDNASDVDIDDFLSDLYNTITKYVHIGKIRFQDELSENDFAIDYESEKYKISNDVRKFNKDIKQLGMKYNISYSSNSIGGSGAGDNTGLHAKNIGVNIQRYLGWIKFRVHSKTDVLAIKKYFGGK